MIGLTALNIWIELCSKSGITCVNVWFNLFEFLDYLGWICGEIISTFLICKLIFDNVDWNWFCSFFVKVVVFSYAQEIVLLKFTQVQLYHHSLLHISKWLRFAENIWQLKCFKLVEPVYYLHKIFCTLGQNCLSLKQSSFRFLFFKEL